MEAKSVEQPHRLRESSVSRYPLMHLENRISFRRELYRICGQYATMIDSERAHRRIAA